jgi:hypothetical protein
MKRAALIVQGQHADEELETMEGEGAARRSNPDAGPDTTQGYLALFSPLSSALNPLLELLPRGRASSFGCAI